MAPVDRLGLGCPPAHPQARRAAHRAPVGQPGERGYGQPPLPGLTGAATIEPMSTSRSFRVEPLPPHQQQGELEMPGELEPRHLLRKTLQVTAALAFVGLVVLLAPGLGELRDRLGEAKPGWIVLAVVFEALSGLSYQVMFRPIFCSHMSRRTSAEIAWSELGMGSIVPASGIGGLALGAWILREGGMPTEKIARRSVAFFLIKSSVNFVAVVVVGVLMWAGVGPHFSPWLTIFFAAAAAVAIAAILAVPRLGLGEDAPPDASRTRRAVRAARRALVKGISEAVAIVKTGHLGVILGSIGYWAWDNAVLWATFKAFGYSPPVTVILMGSLIGRLGGLLPLPGGLGGIDGGLLGPFVVYGAPLPVTAAAILAYRVILFWLPLLVGAVAFVSLRRGLNKEGRPDLCVVPAAT